jgi:hypothetical protein
MTNTAIAPTAQNRNSKALASERIGFGGCLTGVAGRRVPAQIT